MTELPTSKYRTTLMKVYDMYPPSDVLLMPKFFVSIFLVLGACSNVTPASSKTVTAMDSISQESEAVIAVQHSPVEHDLESITTLSMETGCGTQLPRGFMGEWQLMNLLVKLGELQRMERSTPDPSIVDVGTSLAEQRMILTESGEFSINLKYFALLSDELQRSSAEEVIMTKEELKCFVAPSTGLLVSDGITHHWVPVSGVDYETGKVYLFDGWYKQSFFLAPDLEDNERGRLLRWGDDYVIEVPLETVMRYLQGMAVVAGDDFKDELLITGRTSSNNPDNLAAVGLSLLSEYDFQSFRLGLPILETALALAKRSGDAATINRVRGQLIYALLLSYMSCVVVEANNERGEACIQISDQQQDLKHAYDRSAELGQEDETGLSLIPPDRLTKIGHRIYQSGSSEGALEYMNAAIARDTNTEDPYIIRGSILLSNGDVGNALRDAMMALQINTSKIKKRVRVGGDQIAVYFKETHPDTSITLGSSSGLLYSRRTSILQLLRDIYMHEGDQTGLLMVGQEFVKMTPNNPMGHQLIAMANWSMGNVAAARAAARRAIDAAQTEAEKEEVRTNLMDILSK